MVRAAAETYASGGALASEMNLFKDVGEEHKKRRAKAIHTRRLAESRKLAALAPTKPLDLSLGGSVFVAPGCLDGAGMAVSQRRIIRENGSVLVDDPIGAVGGYIVVTSPGDPGRVNRWAAVLAGCALISPDYFLSGGKSGSCMCWRPAVAVKRDVWISAELLRDDPLLANLLKWASRLPASKWRLREEWDAAAYLEKQKTQKTLIGIVTARQKALRAFQRHRHAMTPDDFVQFVAKLKPSASGYVTAGSAPSSSSSVG